MQFRYQFRVYPTPGQQICAARVFGCRRVIWNDALARIKLVKESNKLLGNPKGRSAPVGCASRCAPADPSGFGCGVEGA
ncbi:helix-turn-helix domain-containing protein [Streptomyces sp. NPDC048357]|uniref:helix-turn-helix domain-containing protein n=1 Tax=Streptomyces sp. NPDC048357 TaxID=3154719 RepID=UPI003427CE94